MTVSFDIEVKTAKYKRKQTIIKIHKEELGLTDHDIHNLLIYLKKKLGTGGYIEDGKIILRGDMRKRARRVLESWLLKIMMKNRE